MSVRALEEELYKAALGKMERAIQLLPELRKLAYLEAVQQVPHLAEMESPPIRFLRFTGHENATEAADLLCSYWESRKAIFGERAFLPMNQTGHGALDQEDIVHLDLGSFAFLPNSVLFHEPSTLVRTSERNKLRLSFYLWSILSENEESQRQGYVVVVPLSSTTSCANFKLIEDIVFRAMPVRIKRVHLLCCPSKAELRTFYAKYFPKALKNMTNLLGTKEIIHVSVADRLQDFAKVMASRGLNRSGLPGVLGGTWTLRENFLHWKRERLVLETGRYSKSIPVTDGVTVSQDEETSTLAALTVQHASAGFSASSGVEPSTERYIAASFSPELSGLDESPHSGICCPTEGSLFDSTNVSSSEPGLATFQEGESAREELLGDAREGSIDTIDERPSLLNRWQRKLEAALTAIPPEERQAYSEAVERAPHLLKTEPGPLSFLVRAEDFDANAAAGRAAAFWALRKDIFGDRAFLPMNQTGNGALSREDLEVMRKGLLMYSGLDSQGRSILVAINSRLGKKTSGMAEHFKRILFYFACVACKNNELTQKHGLVLIRFVDPLMYRGAAKVFDPIISTCCGPFTIHTVVQGNLESDIINAIAGPNIAGEGNVRQHYIHAGESVGEVVAKLRSHGISKTSLPPSLGGPWTVEKFECWCRRRVVIEREQADNSSPISLNTIHARPKKRQAPTAGTDAAGIAEDGLTKSPTALTAQHPNAGFSVSSWGDPKSIPSAERYIAASFTPEHPGLDENPHGGICCPVEGSLFGSTNVSSSKPRLATVEEGGSAKEERLGDAKEGNIDTIDVLNRWQRELEEALIAIPPEERQAYSEAVERAPHLLKTIPGPLSFLRAEDFDANAAAGRVAAFWALRKNIFGDRAFLPMNQTGNGALAREDLEVMRTGFLMYSGRDSHGRSILVLLRSRMPTGKRTSDLERMKRILFYFACVACEDNEVNHKHGLVVIRVMDPLLSRAKNLNVFAQILSTCCGPPTIHAIVQGNLEPGIINAIAGPNVSGERNVRQHYIHAGESVGEVVAKLRSHGISEKSLPPLLGGPWTVEEFECWCRKRVAIEREQVDHSSSISMNTIHARKRQAPTAGIDFDIGEDRLNKWSDKATLTKEQKLTAGPRRRGNSKTAEDLPFPSCDT